MLYSGLIPAELKNTSLSSYSHISFSTLIFCAVYDFKFNLWFLVDTSWFRPRAPVTFITGWKFHFIGIVYSFRNPFLGCHIGSYARLEQASAQKSAKCWRQRSLYWGIWSLMMYLDRKQRFFKYYCSLKLHCSWLTWVRNVTLNKRCKT